MSVTNPPSTSSGTGSFSSATSLKRRLQAVFDGFDDLTDRATAHFSYQPKVRIADRYKVIGFISSGTYGRVYKAISRRPAGGGGGGGGGGSGDEFAIKKFKPDKEGEQVSYTGISQSAIREMSLCTELSHPSVIRLVEIILEDKCIFMVFEYAEHDLLQIIHHHTQQPRHPIPASVIRSIMFQLLNGCQYLHANWVLHRDLKPANIMVTSGGEVKIGDLGLARRFEKPLQPLYNGDKVIVTIWYRAPELILGSYHYTPAIDMWAVGCIFAELISLRPIFKGEEAKIDNKKTVPFQRNQMQRIVDIMGMPNKENWPLLTAMPEAGQLGTLQPPVITNFPQYRRNVRAEPPASIQAQAQAGNAGPAGAGAGGAGGATGAGAGPPGGGDGSQLERWYFSTITQGMCVSAAQFASAPLGVTSSPLGPLGAEGFNLLARLLEYDPSKRLTAAQALQHSFFGAGDRVSANCFEGLKVEYPHRRVSQDDNDIRTNSVPGTKRNGLADDSLVRPMKRAKDR